MSFSDIVKLKLARPLVGSILTIMVLLGSTACGSIFGPEEVVEPTATPTNVPVPTFTPTAITIQLPPATPTALQETAPEATPEPAQALTVAEALAAAKESGDSAVTSEEESASSTPSLTTTITATVSTTVNVSTTLSTTVPSDSGTPPLTTDPVAIVIGEIVNVRSGPGTVYDLVGSAAAAEQLPIIGRNVQGDWWQVCCFEVEQPGWLYGPLVDVQNTESVAVAADIPPAPTPLPEPTVVDVAVAPTAPSVEPPSEEAPPPAPAPADQGGTAGNFDPNAQFHIVDYKVYGFDENNGGIFNNGGQHIIFINVLDENGQGINGAVVKDALDENFSITTGSKGPGRTEFEMFWEPYKLYVASIPSGPVTSQITNQMNTAKPHIPDIIGKMGPADNEYAICPTPDDRCEPPFFHAHWSYEVTFQKVK